MIYGLFRDGDVKCAENVFENMENKDIVSCNSLISDCFMAFDNMHLRDVISWNLIIAGLVKDGDFDKAEDDEDYGGSSGSQISQLRKVPHVGGVNRICQNPHIYTSHVQVRDLSSQLKALVGRDIETLHWDSFVNDREKQ
ncbi:pentatricopeptide (PPR) repeat-containing protein-like [Striga asiatica]|uniref:Pentatricopeptide (PPR) repeat-containing protein-like n=1 Tax=Striga asiatica TaxID=4170 RepID=A0A5A7PKB4_STRAF|nr:pentatricopeptide (PPR) repeat-containing protein-like [Striga asiatica]